MLEKLLELDGKGIFPADRELESEYIERGTSTLDAKIDKKAVYDHQKANYEKKCRVRKKSAPEEAYRFMRMVYGCDVKWVPYFKAQEKSPKAYNGLCIKLRVAPNIMPCIIIYKNVTNETCTAVHEAIHTVRTPLERYVDREERIMSELFAEWNQFPSYQSCLIENREKTDDILSIMAKVYNKLHNCFGDKRDYCFIRLSEGNVYTIADRLDEEHVKDYFKEKAMGDKLRTICGELPSLRHKSYTVAGSCFETRPPVNAEIGQLRFQIMCEKLGL